ncbi:hypothetical protein D3C76_1784200 [compost metagenome]
MLLGSVVGGLVWPSLLPGGADRAQIAEQVVDHLRSLPIEFGLHVIGQLISSRDVLAGLDLGP